MSERLGFKSDACWWPVTASESKSSDFEFAGTCGRQDGYRSVQCQLNLRPLTLATRRASIVQRGVVSLLIALRPAVFSTV